MYGLGPINFLLPSAYPNLCLAQWFAYPTFLPQNENVE